MTAYIAKEPNTTGYVNYDATENKTWNFLYERQMKLIENRACKAYIDGLNVLGMDIKNVPQLPDVNKALFAATGWQVEAVPALIPFGQFFELLASKKFPAATFIRRPEEIDYLQEPDIFHELYGHCPLLTDPVFAEFVYEYGKLGLSASKKERIYLARLFWFTVEFGLIQEPEGLRIYGAGILSSSGETSYSLESDKPERKPFDLQTALRTPYRIDIFQPIYFIIENFSMLYNVFSGDLISDIHQAIESGDFAPTFPPKPTVVKAHHDC